MDRFKEVEYEVIIGIRKSRLICGRIRNPQFNEDITEVRGYCALYDRPCDNTKLPNYSCKREEEFFK